MNHVFAENSTQEEIFQKITDKLDDLLLGKDLTIVAYGAAKSGKTYTMIGDKVGGYGIIPRSIKEIFGRIVKLEGSGVDASYHLELSFVELHNNNFRNLLNGDKSLKSRPSTLSTPQKNRREEDKAGDLVNTSADLGVIGGAGGDKIDIHESRRLGVFLFSSAPNFKVPVQTAQEALELLAAGNKRRTTRLANGYQSSRGHAILTLYVECRTLKPQGAPKTPGGLRSNLRCSKVNFVDLAGGDRSTQNLKEPKGAEAQYINVSLSAFGDCLHALAKNALAASKFSEKSPEKGSEKERDTGLDSSALNASTVSESDDLIASGVASPSHNASALTTTSQTLAALPRTHHVPLLNSKLTHLLKDALLGFDKMIFITTVQPDTQFATQTHTALRYACWAKHLQTGSEALRELDFLDYPPQCLDVQEIRLRKLLEERSLEFEFRHLQRLSPMCSPVAIADRLLATREVGIQTLPPAEAAVTGVGGSEETLSSDVGELQSTVLGLRAELARVKVGQEELLSEMELLAEKEMIKGTARHEKLVRVEKESQNLKKELQALSEKKQAKRTERTPLSAEAKVMRNQVVDLTAKLERSRAELLAARSNVLGKRGMAELATCKEKLATQDKLLKEQRGKLSHLESQLRVERQLRAEALAGSVDELTKERRSLEAARQQEKQLRLQITKLKDANSGLTSEVQTNKEKAVRRIEALNKQLAEAKQEEEKLITKISEREAATEKWRQQWEALDKKLKEGSGKRKEQAEQMERAVADLASATDTISKQEAQLKELQEQSVSLTVALSTASAQLVDAEEASRVQAVILEERAAELEAFKARGLKLERQLQELQDALTAEQQTGAENDKQLTTKIEKLGTEVTGLREELQWERVVRGELELTVQTLQAEKVEMVGREESERESRQKELQVVYDQLEAERQIAQDRAAQVFVLEEKLRLKEIQPTFESPPEQAEGEEETQVPEQAEGEEEKEKSVFTLNVLSNEEEVEPVEDVEQQGGSLTARVVELEEEVSRLSEKEALLTAELESAHQLLVQAEEQRLEFQAEAERLRTRLIGLAQEEVAKEQEIAQMKEALEQEQLRAKEDLEQADRECEELGAELTALREELQWERVVRGELEVAVHSLQAEKRDADVVEAERAALLQQLEGATSVQLQDLVASLQTRLTQEEVKREEAVAESATLKEQLSAAGQDCDRLQYELGLMKATLKAAQRGEGEEVDSSPDRARLMAAASETKDRRQLSQLDQLTLQQEEFSMEGMNSSPLSTGMVQWPELDSKRNSLEDTEVWQRRVEALEAELNQLRTQPSPPMPPVGHNDRRGREFSSDGSSGEVLALRSRVQQLEAALDSRRQLDVSMGSTQSDAPSEDEMVVQRKKEQILTKLKLLESPVKEASPQTTDSPQAMTASADEFEKVELTELRATRSGRDWLLSVQKAQLRLQMLGLEQPKQQGETLAQQQGHGSNADVEGCLKLLEMIRTQREELGKLRRQMRLQEEQRRREEARRMRESAPLEAAKADLRALGSGGRAGEEDEEGSVESAHSDVVSGGSRRERELLELHHAMRASRKHMGQLLRVEPEVQDPGEEDSVSSVESGSSTPALQGPSWEGEGAGEESGQFARLMADLACLVDATNSEIHSLLVTDERTQGLGRAE